MLYIKLFWEFFQTGLFAVGGGMATLPFLYDISDRTGWYTHQQLADMIAVSESTPGAIGVNMATYSGYLTAGLPGALISTLGLITPSIIVILLVAAFNTIGSLTMLIIDKKDDIKTLSHLGASTHDIRQIFLLEGWFVSMLGALVGIVLGLVICLVQQEFGLIKLGNGSDYVISAYPVQVQALDILYVLIAVLGLTAFTSWIPTRKINVEGV